MSGFRFENVEPEVDPGVMAMIVLSFNECCAEVHDASIESRRTAGRLRTNMAAIKPAATKPESSPNWSTWFSHHHGNPPEVTE